MTRSDQINSIQRKIASILSRPFNEDSVPHLMIRSRQLLEVRGLKKTYPHVYFYCNWTMHPDLSHPNTVTELLDNLSEELSATSGEKEYNDAVLEVIGLQHLRREFIECYEAEGLPTDRFHNKSAWKDFLSFLLESLLDAPIIRPQKDIPRAQAKYPVCATQLRLVYRDDPALEGFEVPEDWRVLWICNIAQTDATIVAPFNLPEPTTAFRDP